MSVPTPVLVVVGNPRPRSRTTTVATALAAALATTDHFGFTAEDVIELADGFDPSGRDATANAALVRRAEDARLILVATPVYKAGFTGLLKTFLDGLSARALAGAVAVPVTLAAAPTHRVLADLALRPVLAELGAALPVPALRLGEDQLDDLDELVREWLDDNVWLLRATTTALSPEAVGS